MIRAGGEKDVVSLKENIRRSELIKLFNWQENVMFESGTSHTHLCYVNNIISHLSLYWNNGFSINPSANLLQKRTTCPAAVLILRFSIQYK